MKEEKVVMAIDPGSVESAYVIWNGKQIHLFDKVDNYVMLEMLLGYPDLAAIAIEQVASYGMPVGKDVFETVFWSGRFYQKAMTRHKIDMVLRKDVKMHVCKSNQAKDSNIITALVDQFSDRHEYGKYGKGRKKNPGFFYGFYKDIWQAFALAVYYHDNLKEV